MWIISENLHLLLLFWGMCWSNHSRFLFSCLYALSTDRHRHGTWPLQLSEEAILIGTDGFPIEEIILGFVSSPASLVTEAVYTVLAVVISL